MPGEYILTMPGSYHGGFSTGLNIGEAVNFVTSKWINHGLECQDIYRKTREKIPCFSIEWVMTENIRNLDKVTLDRSSLLELRDRYKALHKEERKVRDFIINDILG